MDSLGNLIHEADKAFKPELNILLYCELLSDTKSLRRKRLRYGINSLPVIPEDSLGLLAKKHSVLDK